MPKTHQTVHHIMFNENVDGVTAAAIFLHNHVAGGLYRLYPVRVSKKDDVDSIISNMSLKEGRDILVILNFQNHAKSDFWVSHKFDKSMGNRPVRNSKVIYDPEAGCTSKLVQAISPTRPVTKYSDSFLEVVETISKESYRSAYQIFNDTHSVMLFRAMMDLKKPEEMMFCRMVELLRTTHMDFRKSAFQMKIGKNYMDSLRMEAESISKSMTVYSNCSVVNQRWATQFPRYAEFFVKRELKYAIRLTRISKDRLYVRISYNLWHDEGNEFNITEALTNIPFVSRAGGEYDSSGGIIKSENMEKFLDKIISILNKEEEPMNEQEMEKTAVDSENDPVESQAQEMVKTGESDNLSDAREKASEGDQNDTPSEDSPDQEDDASEEQTPEKEEAPAAE